MYKLTSRKYHNRKRVKKFFDRLNQRIYKSSPSFKMWRKLLSKFNINKKIYQKTHDKFFFEYVEMKPKTHQYAHLQA